MEDKTLPIIEATYELIRMVGVQVGIGAVLFIFGLYKEWWVMGTQYREMKSQRDRLVSVVEANARIADNSLEIIKR